MRHLLAAVLACAALGPTLARADFGPRDPSTPLVLMPVSDGYHDSEVMDAVERYTEAGMRVRVFTTAGGPLRGGRAITPDPVSVIPRGRIANLFGLGTQKNKSAARVALDAQLARELEDARPLASITRAEIASSEAVYVPGGHGAHQDFILHGDGVARAHPALERLVRIADQKKKVIIAVCHATGAVALTGVLDGKKTTGYPDLIDTLAVAVTKATGGRARLVDDKFLDVPKPTNGTIQRARTSNGAVARALAVLNPYYHRTGSDRIVTGQGPGAVRATVGVGIRMIKARR